MLEQRNEEIHRRIVQTQQNVFYSTFTIDHFVSVPNEQHAAKLTHFIHI